MPVYYVQQKATVWHEVRISADTPEQAMAEGIEALENGEGFEVNDSFQWADGYWIGDINHEQIELMENE